MPYCLIDTFTSSSKTSVNKNTSLFKYNLGNSSPFLLSNTLIISFVRSISLSSG